MKFLIIRFSAMGDVVLTTPVIRCLKSQIKDAEVHFVTKQSNLVLVEANPYLHKIHTFRSSLQEVLPQLKAEHFDYVIDLQNNLRSAVLKFRLFAVSFSFHKLNIEKWLITALKINILPKEHIVDRYLNTVRFFGVKNDQQGLDYFIPEKAAVDFSLIPISHRQDYIAFCIGGTYATKRLPMEKIIKICSRLKSPVFLLGGKEDQAVGHEIAQQLGDHIYNGCGKFSIHELASIVQHAKAVITHDTGFMHIAAAFKKNIVSVWEIPFPNLE